MQQLITTPGQVGEVLRARRTSRRIPQRELAAKLGISQGRLSTLETAPAALTLDRLILLANLLDLEVVLRDKTEVPNAPSEW
jgi:HTH-type transcriptional regulator / antitoxin HipB